MWAAKCIHAFYQAIADYQTSSEWQEKIDEAYIKNKWFTTEQQHFALAQWKYALSPNQVESWLNKYSWKPSSNETLGLILAGNIPLVGLHDIICGIAAGFKVNLKLSSDDEVLPKFILEKASNFEPELNHYWEITQKPTKSDRVIATGGNNTARYFEYYFRDVPLLLRKSRNAVGLLTGNESETDLKNIGEDVFRYFGLGCRNITHLYLPVGMDITKVFDAWNIYSDAIHHNKYANNYHYHKAILLMNLDKHLDTGFLIAQEKKQIYSPIGTINYSFYQEIDEALAWYELHSDQIQCKVSIAPLEGFILPGQSQRTTLHDYADGIDTIKWLNNEATRVQG